MSPFLKGRGVLWPVRVCVRKTVVCVKPQSTEVRVRVRVRATILGIELTTGTGPPEASAGRGRCLEHVRFFFTSCARRRVCKKNLDFFFFAGRRCELPKAEAAL